MLEKSYNGIEMDGQMKPKMIYVEESITSKIQYRALRDVIEDLEKMSKNHPDATIDLVTLEGYDSHYAQIILSYIRPQTEKEVEEELSLKDKNKATRLAQYLKLKKEFEK